MRASLSRISSLIFLISASLAFSQEAQEPIRFQIPRDSSGMPVLTPAPKPAPAATPAAAPASTAPALKSQSAPLNLAALTARDSESFEAYSQRHSLVEDSIIATRMAFTAAKGKAESGMLPLAPKGEFEKQAEYDIRKQEWDNELKQRIDWETKALYARLAELEKARIKIIENQTFLYGSLEIKSEPPADLWIDKERMATPAEYKLLIPGTVKIRLYKKGYNLWDTTLQVAPREKYKINVVLEEKSIFSQKNELDFKSILAKDTTMQGYAARIEIIKARKAEIDAEMVQIVENFGNSYPPLAPQGESESPEAFERRREAWANEGTRRYAELQEKHSSYRKKLERSVRALNDYIVALQGSMLNETVLAPKISLGAYDSEMESFELIAHDTASRKTPFYFSGRVGVPLSAAPSINRAAPGFITAVQFINFPFETDSAKVNLAMSKLQLSMGGQALNVDGSFMEIEKYKSMAGYGAWKPRADSLLSGNLKPKGLDYNYAIGKEAAKALAGGSAAQKESEPGDGLGWRAWTRIAAYSLAAGCAALATLKHIDAQKHKDDIDKIGTPINRASFEIAKDGRSRSVKKLKDSEGQRMNFGIGAGALALAGTLTFFF